MMASCAAAMGEEDGGGSPAPAKPGQGSLAELGYIKNRLVGSESDSAKVEVELAVSAGSRRPVGAASRGIRSSSEVEAANVRHPPQLTRAWSMLVSQGVRSTGGHPGTQRPGSRQDFKQERWDVMISYRVDADQELAKELYWLLHHRTVVDGGKERKLRVFWDRESLKMGERWEEGFANAICNCSLVVLVMSRETFVLQGKYNVETLEESSSCDNVLLEYNLALELNKLNSTAIMPLFVGDRVDGKFTNFFHSGCMPTLCSFCRKHCQENKGSTQQEKHAVPKHECQGVVVRKISEKVEFYLAHNAGVAHDQMPERKSLKTVVSSVTEFQGHFLQGDPYEAVKVATEAIYDCAIRVVKERRGRREVQHLKFSTPQGEEVYEWLADKRLLPFATIFALNKLDSLRKVSRLTHEEVIKINEELYVNQQGGEDSTRHGTRVALEDAIEVLKGDPRCQNLKTRLENYADADVSVLNLLAASNQAEIFLANQWWSLFLMSVCFLAVVVTSIYNIPVMTDLVELSKQRQSILSFSVNVSGDGMIWYAATHASCAHDDVVRAPCLFDNNALSNKPDSKVAHLFEPEVEARYIKVVPVLWDGMGNSRGASMRLAMLGEKGHLDYRILSDGVAGQAWLQAGCSFLSTLNDQGILQIQKDKQQAKRGLWAPLDDRIGEVQCCVSGPAIHVCTRDGCLSGDRDEVKYTWHEAKAKCEEKGWRLCKRAELNRDWSVGCCQSDRCGYNNELVWSSNLGAEYSTAELQYGQLDGNTAIEDVATKAIDLGETRILRGIELQGGVSDGPSPTCMISRWIATLHAGAGVLSLLLGMQQSPFMKVNLFFSWIFFPLGLVLGMSTVVVSLSDQTVPGVLSSNMACPEVESTFPVFFVSFYGFYALVWSGAVLLVQRIHPSCTILFLLTTWLGAAAILCEINGFFFWSVPLLVGAFGIPVVVAILSKVSVHSAKLVTYQDNVMYNQSWDEVKQQANSRVDLEEIQSMCRDARLEITQNRNQIAAMWRSKDLTPLFCIPSDLSLLERFLFWIRWDGAGRYSKAGKIRQMTADIDMLFEEAAVLNDKFFAFLEARIRVGRLCRGPVKRPDRAFQKVVRKYHRDARCLTDLVRCCILLESIEDVRRALSQILEISVVFGEEEGRRIRHADEASSGPRHSAAHGDEEHQGLVANSKFVKLCKVKDNFTPDEVGFRFVGLNLEVGWTIESESVDELTFVPVGDFDKKHVRTHICEVQLVLKSTYELKVSGFHDNFVKSRNMLAQ